MLIKIDDENKLELADGIIKLMQNYLTSEDMPVMIGELTKEQGLRGFDVAEAGHPVFEFKDRYLIYLSNKITTVCVPYYKESLKPFIKPIKQ